MLPPGAMEFLPSAVEAEIGSVLSLPLAVYAIKGEQFRALCQRMKCSTIINIAFIVFILRMCCIFC